MDDAFWDDMPSPPKDDIILTVRLPVPIRLFALLAEVVTHYDDKAVFVTRDNMLVFMSPEDENPSPGP